MRDKTLAFAFPKINLSVKLIGIIAFAMLFGHLLPESTQAFLYAISLTLKEGLLFVLPIIIFSCLFSCLFTFQGSKAVGFMLVLFIAICLSNYISTMIAYGVGALNLSNLTVPLMDQSLNTTALSPTWDIQFPQWVTNDQALYLGLGLGTFFSFFPNPKAKQFSDSSKALVYFFLEKCFVPVLPFFVLGFILKMQFDGVLNQIIKSYLELLIVITTTYILYLLLLFFIAAKGNVSRWLEYLRNILPVGLMAFSTMSSLASMPTTIKAAQKNTQNDRIAQAVIPATVNVHMIGVGIAIPLMAFSILLSFGYPLPSFATYCQFALYFILAQFAVAAVPAGGILVMLPILETHLGFTSEMSALITALFILFDPVVTITNVLGNSALVIYIAKFFQPETEEEQVLTPDI